MMTLLVVWYVYFLLAPARNRAFLGTMRCGAAGLGSVVSGAASFAGAAEAGGAAEAEAASNAAEGMGGGGGSDGSGGATGFFVRGLRGSFVADGTFGAAVGGNGGCARESSDCSKSLTLTGCFLTPTSFLRPSTLGGAPAGGEVGVKSIVRYGLGDNKVEKEKERNKVEKQKKIPNLGYRRVVNHSV